MMFSQNHVQYMCNYYFGQKEQHNYVDMAFKHNYGQYLPGLIWNGKTSDKLPVSQQMMT